MSALRRAPPDLPAALKEIVDYRKSGLSLNHVVGCPLDCGYCVRHLFHNFDMKQPHLIVEDLQAIDLLTSHWAFRANVTPIQIFNRATDPFLPGVKEHLFAVLEELDQRCLRNPVLVISRWKIDERDIARLERLQHIKLTILVTWSGIDDDRIEPVDSGIAEASLKALALHATRTKKILYWRPLIPNFNDTDDHLSKARILADYSDATVFSGLFFRDEIREYFRQLNVPDLYHVVARRKILPRDSEARVLMAFEGKAIFRKTSCGVAFAHGIADYNGHFGISEICDICPMAQVQLCAASHRKPTLDVERRAKVGHLRG